MFRHQGKHRICANDADTRKMQDKCTAEDFYNDWQWILEKQKKPKFQPLSDTDLTVK